MDVNQGKRILTIIEGKEQSLYTSREIKNEASFMFPAYHQAIRALTETIHQTQQFHFETYRQSKQIVDNALFQYGGNIIAFVAQRGGGKTRTMLSFADILDGFTQGTAQSIFETNSVTLNNAEKLKFYIMSPIAPSSLEGNQNILYVILSRLYRYAEELLMPGKACDYITERKKNELIQAFNHCLSGINGIKRQHNGPLADLSALQDINDGIALKKHFYDLVQCLIEITAPRCDTRDCYLILQIDDSDSQGAKTYEVLEDIRKYLLIPNLVILMSADLGMLHNGILETYREQFKNDPFIENELSRMCRKYIDKLIPPSHMVHLPQLDKLLEAGSNQLTLKYLKNETPPGGKDSYALEWDNGTWNAQDLVLMLIYRKTGVIFVRPRSHVHNIIPQTMRGFNQLLHLLNDMEDIPQLNEQSWESIGNLAEGLWNQLVVTEKNLSLFISYFVMDWIPVKITNTKDRYFLSEFAKTASVNRSRLAASYLYKRYPDSTSRNNENDNPNPYTRTDLDKLLISIETNHRSQEDFLLLFSVRTILTLESHRMVLWHKREIVQHYLSNSTHSTSVSPFIVFDFEPEKMNLPLTYLLSEDSKTFVLGESRPYLTTTDEGESNKPVPFCVETKFNAKNLSDAWNIFRNVNDGSKKCKDLLGKLLVSEKKKDFYTINLFNILSVFLRLGCEDFWPNSERAFPLPCSKEVMTQQIKFYQIQETALLIASNWDIQREIYATLNRHTKKLNRTGVIDAIATVFSAVDSIISKINSGTISACLNEQNKSGVPQKLTQSFEACLQYKETVYEYDGRIETYAPVFTGDMLMGCISVLTPIVSSVSTSTDTTTSAKESIVAPPLNGREETSVS